MSQSASAQCQLGCTLITGGAGFIGAAFPSLLRNTTEVIAFDNLHPQIHATGNLLEALDSRATLVVGDVRSASDWNRLLSNFTPKIGVHLAAETGIGQSLTESTRYATVNVVGATQMLDGFRCSDVMPGGIVPTSSRAIYSEGAWQDTEVTSSYPGQRSFNLEAAIFQRQNLYGPGRSLISSYIGIMSVFCRMAMAGKTVSLYEDGIVRRDFMLIDDVTRAVVAAAYVSAVPDLPLNIGLGTVHTVPDAAQLISPDYSAPSPYVTEDYRLGDVRHLWVDNERAKVKLDWTPQHDPAYGIHRFANWTNEQPDVQPA
ncbi:NAD-dependent epimerase/dehydratase family protein [Lysinibacter sp. HNR]|uniref:NAD-dependent epimerase/dehydratase family protein n=1 Tax=Lysinibacter sp. HNR TaxID=3031408 RepID=UPI002434FD7D|nr:NAD-dependent epimerase/dehydratase family protein [Lysinibacter sp. HNR]WGD38078.1 NAD-dependent epimerase/dehydratase family protein [Lysinibacter sp. HNR]